MTTVTTASQTSTTVVVSENGGQGLPGADGTDGSGFNQVRKSMLDNPLCHLFKTNKIVEASAPTGTDADASWVRAQASKYINRYGEVETAAINIPREEVEGFLIEGASTNKLTYSEDLSNAAWVASGSIAVVADNITAPDGTMTADKVTDSDGLSTTSLIQTKAITSTSQEVTFSYFVKAGTATVVGMRIVGLGGVSVDKLANFDLSTGLVTTSTVTRPKIKTLADGWFRISGTITLDAGNTSIQCRISTLNTGLTGDFYAWGAQLEEKPFATSYIATTTAAVTRAGEVVGVPYLNNHPDLLIEGGFSYSVTCDLLGPDPINSMVVMGVTGYQYSMLRVKGSIATYFRSAIGVPVTVPDVTASFKIVATVDSANNVTVYINGVTTGSVVSIPNLANTPGASLLFGTGTGDAFYGHIKDARVYDFVLNADEAEYLS